MPDPRIQHLLRRAGFGTTAGESAAYTQRGFLATLDAKHPEAFDGLFADLRGDALVAAGRAADARNAYEAALAKLDPKSTYRNFVQVKHDALGGTAKAPDAAATGAAGTAPAATPAAAAAPSRDAQAAKAAPQTSAGGVTKASPANGAAK